MKVDSGIWLVFTNAQFDELDGYKSYISSPPCVLLTVTSLCQILLLRHRPNNPKKAGLNLGAKIGICRVVAGLPMEGRMLGGGEGVVRHLRRKG